MLKRQTVGKSPVLGNRVAKPFLLGEKPRGWLNRGVKPLVFRPKSLPPASPEKKRYGVLGFPVAHSLSPAMQEAGFQALGITAEYLRVEIPPGDLANAMPSLRAAGFQGWNCTLPHKETMFALCDETDENARESKAVNTVTVSARGLGGTSTDADGWEEDIQAAWKLDIPTQRVLLLGCGGIGRTLAFRLAKRGCRQLTLSNRSSGKAIRLAEEIRQGAKFPVYLAGWERGPLAQAMKQVDLLIQATPLGLADNEALPLAAESLHKGIRVYDTVYRKDFTPLVRMAKSREIPARDGLGMLLHQGARSLSIWTGQPAPIPVMRTALEKAAGRIV